MSTRKVIGRCLIGLILPALIVVPVGVNRWHVDHEGRKLRDAAVARIEATDPRWRWEDIEADLPVLRDQDNASLLVAEFRNTVGLDRFFQINFHNEQDPIHAGYGTPRNHIPTDFAYSLIDKELDGTEVAWPVVARLATTPRGRRTLLPALTWRERRQPDEERAGAVLNYLEWEAEQLARTHQRHREETVALAYLNVARIEEVQTYTEGGLSTLLRLEGAARLVERLLALDVLGDRLSRLQTEFALEAEVERFRPAVRETRAVYDCLFRALAAQQASLMTEFTGRSSEATIREGVDIWLYRPHAAADWAGALDFATDALAVADLPDPARSSAFAAIPLTPADGRHPFSLGCAQNLKGLLDSSLQTRATLRCTATALAVERFRRQTGEWPVSLDAIPKAILPAVPADPFTGGALGFARTPDGVTISSTGLRVPFRLYDPNKRRLPPLPPPTGDID